MSRSNLSGTVISSVQCSQAQREKCKRCNNRNLRLSIKANVHDKSEARFLCEDVCKMADVLGITGAMKNDLIRSTVRVKVRNHSKQTVHSEERHYIRTFFQLTRLAEELALALAERD